MSKTKIFYDADALFSASFSENGAAKALLSSKNLIFYTSSKCLYEANTALQIKYGLRIKNEITSRFKIIDSESEKSFIDFVHDKYDEHVIEACHKSGCRFLVTYNTKDYKLTKIESELGIIVCVPGRMIFYDRNVLS